MNSINSNFEENIFRETDDIYNKSSLDVIPNLVQDCIFIDAPWTKNYKESKSIRLYMDRQEISEIYNRIMKIINHENYRNQ